LWCRNTKSTDCFLGTNGIYRRGCKLWKLSRIRMRRLWNLPRKKSYGFKITVFYPISIKCFLYSYLISRCLILLRLRRVSRHFFNLPKFIWDLKIGCQNISPFRNDSSDRVLRSGVGRTWLDWTWSDWIGSTFFDSIESDQGFETPQSD
jgi:hypothetical protein